MRKWVGRYLTQGEPGLRDASSRPQVSPRTIAPSTAPAIVELRRRFLTQARIAQSLCVSASTVSRVLARAGLSRRSDLMLSEPVVRYEHAHPGDPLGETSRYFRASLVADLTLDKVSRGMVFMTDPISIEHSLI